MFYIWSALYAKKNLKHQDLKHVMSVENIKELELLKDVEHYAEKNLVQNGENITNITKKKYRNAIENDIIKTQKNSLKNLKNIQELNMERMIMNEKINACYVKKKEKQSFIISFLKILNKITKKIYWLNYATHVIGKFIIKWKEFYGKLSNPLNFKIFSQKSFMNTFLVKPRAWIVLQKFDPTPWKRVIYFDYIRQGIEWGISNPDIKTIVIDSAAELSDLAEAEWLKETGKDRVYPMVLWGQIYDKIDPLIQRVVDAKKYLVTTSRLKDEYIGDTKTGRRVRDTYKKLPWNLSMAVELTYGIRDKQGRMHYDDHKFGKVIKNNFFGVDIRTGTTTQKPYLFDISYEGVCNEMLKPWNGKEGVKTNDAMAKIIEEAKAWIDSHD